MKKNAIVYGVLPVLILGISVAGYASARVSTGQNAGFRQTAGEFASNHESMFKERALLLGISETDVKNAWSKGQTMRDLAKEKGISEDDLHAKVHAVRLEQVKSELKTMVDKKIITQTQADQRLASMEKNKDVRGAGMGGGRGVRGSHQNELNKRQNSSK